MIRYYQEHPIFDRYSRFEEGRLSAIKAEEFAAVRAQAWRSPKVLGRWEGPGFQLFEGANSPQHSRFPRRIYFQITRACNLRCPYCFIRAQGDGAHVPIEAIRRIAHLCGEQGLMEVRLTGGEPSCHPQLLEAVDAFQEAGVYVSVSSNGLIPPRIARALAARKIWLILSVDGPKEIHEQTRGSSFIALSRTVELIRSLRPDLRLRLTGVLSRENLRHIDALSALSRDFGAENLTLIPLRPQVRDPAAREQMLSAQEFYRAIQEMVRASERSGVPISTTIETQFSEKIHRDPVVRKRFACAAGREATNLDYDAERRSFQLYGCSYSPASDLEAPAALRAPFLAGSFPESEPEALMRIWQDDSAWRIFRDPAFRSEECESCSWYSEQKCVGSCPIQNWRPEELELEGDILQQLGAQLKQTGEWYCYRHIMGERGEADGTV